LAKIYVDTEMKNLPEIAPGVLMIHNEMPPYLVLATSIVVGDEFAGVSLTDGTYGEQWIDGDYRVFEGKVTLEN